MRPPACPDPAATSKRMLPPYVFESKAEAASGQIGGPATERGQHRGRPVWPQCAEQKPCGSGARGAAHRSRRLSASWTVTCLFGHSCAEPRPVSRPRVSRGELLVSYDGEQFELAVALRAGASGQHHQGLGAVVGEEDLAVDIDAAEFRMQDDLAVAALGDLMKFPHAAGLGAVVREVGEDPGGSGVAAS